MPIITNGFEAQKIAEGKANGVTRPMLGSIPFKPKQDIPLSLPDGKIYAIATVISVRPGTAKKRKEDDRLAVLDGYTNAAGWWMDFKNRFKVSSEDTELYRS